VVLLRPALTRARLARYDTSALVALGALRGLLAIYHAGSALTSGDRVLAAPPDALGYFRPPRS
jgi:hypothetical protein